MSNEKDWIKKWIPPKKEFYNASEAARILGYQINYVPLVLKRLKLGKFKENRWWITEEELQKLIKYKEMTWKLDDKGKLNYSMTIPGKYVEMMKVILGDELKEKQLRRVPKLKRFFLDLIEKEYRTVAQSVRASDS